MEHTLGVDKEFIGYDESHNVLILVLMEHTLGEEIYYSTIYQPITRKYVQYLTFQRLKNVPLIHQTAHKKAPGAILVSIIILLKTCQRAITIITVSHYIKIINKIKLLASTRHCCIHPLIDIRFLSLRERSRNIQEDIIPLSALYFMTCKSKAIHSTQSI